MRRAWLVILSLILCFLFFYTARSGRDTGVSLRQTGDSYMEGVRIVNRKDGHRDWILTAERADITADGRIAYLKDLEIKIEDRGITVNAGKGTYNMTDKSLTLDGRTVAKGDSYSITSENVKFNSGKDNLATDGAVSLEGKKFRVHGKGMDLNNSEHKVRILSNVKAVFYN